MSRVRPVALPAVLLSTVLLAGCGSGDDGTQTASGSSTSSSSSSASSSAASTTAAGTGGEAEPGDGSTDAPAFPANTEPDTSDASADASLTVRDIRTGRQSGFDRVVFELGGTGTPGWDVRYVDQPASQGSGAPIDVEGAAALQVTITGAQIPDTTGVAEYDGPDPLPGAGTTTVTEVAYDHVFEGTAVAFVGTSGRLPFRVYALSNPARVVVEVRDN